MPVPPVARAIVAHDVEEVRRAVTRALARIQTHRVFAHPAHGTDEAMRLLGRERFDILAAGTRVGAWDGTEFLARVAREQPHVRRVLLDETAAPASTPPTEAHALARLPVDEDAFARLCEALLAGNAPAASASARAGPAREPGRRAPLMRAQLTSELRRIDLELRRLKLQLGMRAVSPEAYERLVGPLKERRAHVETELLRRREEEQARVADR